MKCKLPNLELIEYIGKQLLKNDDGFKNLFKEKTKNTKLRVPLDIEMIAFMQMWGNTSTGFDVDDNGNPYISGQSMTEAYTVVLHERITDYYIVFFDGKPCYMISNPTEKFYEDLKDRNMESKSRANKFY